MKRKFRLFATIEREEAWLEKQLIEGHVLIKTDGYGTYTFSDDTPMGKIKRRDLGVGPNIQDYIIRIDCQTFKSNSEYEEYCSFLKEFGWTGIKSNKKSGKLYFIGKNSDTNELFSDVESRIQRDIRSRNELLTMNTSMLVLYFILFFDLRLILHPSRAFLTPHLFEMQGSLFVKAFLFELPFAILRLGVTFVPIILAIFLFYRLYLSQKAINQYKKQVSL
ncbi:DUF2812 domain-containing protein [Vagococcus silagei]|uniref:DUF2812 domain-containing protein n=1 Tax=Vagococcus silagei TaxID=2508885 RepID=A0A4S3B6K2_9ENTE|nr:DUF2812 domain-containing protein [Vagococcus silagei]THB61550.1 DUF2812 domain-containing protein [Vagococcus silagei]